MSEQAIIYRTDEPTLAAVNDAQRVVLTQSTPPEVLMTRPGKGGKQFTYVEHAWVTATLNEAFGWSWSWEIVEHQFIPVEQPIEVLVLGKLTVHTQRGDLVKMQFGSADVKCDRNGNPLSIGDDLKAASSDGLKKCASLLGIALDLYRSDESQPANKSDGPKSAFFKKVCSEIPYYTHWMHAINTLKQLGFDGYDQSREKAMFNALQKYANEHANDEAAKAA